MNLLTAKIVAMVVMGVGVLLCGLLPIKLRPLILKGEENSKRRRHRERFISGLLCFGAGVLLATVFTHMLPETRMEFEKARKMGLLGGHDHHDDHHHDDGLNKADNIAVVNLPAGPSGPNHDHSHATNHDHSHATDHEHSHATNHDHGHATNHDHSHAAPGRSPSLQFNNQSVPPYKEITLPGSEPRFATLKGDELNNSHTNSHDHDHDHDHDQDHIYPIAELVLCLGFLFIYFVEEFVHKFFLGHKHSVDGEGGHVHHHHSHVPSFGQHTDHKHAKSNGDVHLNNNKDSASYPNWGGQGMDNPVFSGDVETAENQRMRTILLTNGKVLPITSSPTSSPHLNGGSGHSREASLQLNKSAIDTMTEAKPKIDVATNVRGLLIVVALGFHAVFEGMAVGLQEEVMDVWYLFFAISAHKYVIKFCIGLELLENNTPRLQMVLSIITLALMTPIGIAIGIIVTENSGFGGSEHILIIAVLQGLAGGTLLYITFFEIMDRERSKPGARVIKLLCFAAGFAGMASMEAIGGHSH